MGSPSGPTSLRRFRLSNHREMRNAMMIPTTIPPTAPPTIVPVFGEALLFSVLAVELARAGESLEMLV